jgi:hypothetical protein
MATITIRIVDHDQPYTVREMRRRLAQVLSKLDGEQTVSFSFSARIENYTPRTVSTPRDMTHLREPFIDLDGTRTGRINTMPAVLGAPYDLTRGGLLDYAKKMKGPRC